MATRVASVISRQQWLNPLEERLQRAVERGLESLGPRRARLEPILHGDPLGHPLHVMLTDVPLGAWTTALVFDLLAAVTRKDDWDTAARGAIGVGLGGALLAAVAGLADYRQLRPPERRIGLVHGLTNLMAVTAFAASFVRRREAGKGRGLSLLGYALTFAAARLGRQMVYQAGIGVRQVVAVPPSEPAPQESAA